jgi:IS5 family transposase
MREDTANHSTTEMNQRSFASAEYAMKKKRTRREKFLDDMERVVPWARLIAVIEPLYPTSGRVGRQPIGVPRMLRMYCLHVWTRRLLQALVDDEKQSAHMHSACLMGD